MRPRVVLGPIRAVEGFSHSFFFYLLYGCSSMDSVASLAKCGLAKIGSSPLLILYEIQQKLFICAR